MPPMKSTLNGIPDDFPIFRAKHPPAPPAARTIETLVAAVGELLTSFTAEQCANYFAIGKPKEHFVDGKPDPDVHPSRSEVQQTKQASKMELQGEA